MIRRLGWPIVVALVVGFVLIVLTSCGSGGTPFRTSVREVDVDGEPVTCIVATTGGGIALSCDWQGE